MLDLVSAVQGLVLLVHLIVIVWAAWKRDATAYIGAHLLGLLAFDMADEMGLFFWHPQVNYAGHLTVLVLAGGAWFAWNHESSRRQRAMVWSASVLTSILVSYLSTIIPCAWGCGLPQEAVSWPGRGWASPIAGLLPAAEVFLAWLLLREWPMPGRAGVWLALLLCLDALFRASQLLVVAWDPAGWNVALQALTAAAAVLALAPAFWLLRALAREERFSRGRRIRVVALCLLASSAVAFGYLRATDEPLVSVMIQLGLPMGMWLCLYTHYYDMAARPREGARFSPAPSGGRQ